MRFVRKPLAAAVSIMLAYLKEPWGARMSINWGFQQLGDDPKKGSTRKGNQTRTQCVSDILRIHLKKTTLNRETCFAFLIYLYVLSKKKKRMEFGPKLTR